jgi:Zn-dependent M32 family carboxypeptidase
MKDKIMKEIIEWCEKQENTLDIYMEDFVNYIVDKTVTVLFEELKNDLKNEFENGNLKHPFVISDEYYLYLKLKEIKNKILNPELDLDYVEKEE